MEENKKLEKKRKRFAARLRNSKGIDCTETPGPNIVLCNVGQATGFEKGNLERLIEDYHLDIECPILIAQKGESHSFLVFKDIDSAVLFSHVIHGKAESDKNIPLYLSFVKNVPNTEVICSYDDPEGLKVIPMFISAYEQRLLINLFDWREPNNGNRLRNRQVRHYGYAFRYGSNDVDLDNPLPNRIPDMCSLLWKRLEEYGYKLSAPDQLTVNKYNPGHGIPLHVDRHSPFGDTILSVSLGSGVVMDWKHHSGKYVPVFMPAGSILIMQREARYDWYHGIQPRTYDPVIKLTITENEGIRRRSKVISNETVAREPRMSLTFRWTREGPCECVYKTLCDNGKLSNPEDLDEISASNLEKLHVHQVYEQIADHFSSTRHTPWPKVVQFLRRAPPAAVVLDLGAGNGKNVLRRPDILQIAGERSSGLLAECKEHIRGVSGADCVRVDLLDCGLKDACADVVICIAVIHHFSNKARRQQAISTIHRLLRSSGVAFITVWAKDQTRSNYLNSKLRQPTEAAEVDVAGVILPVHENRTQFQYNDLLVPWKKKPDQSLAQLENTLLRYYHVFEEGEIDALCTEVGLVVENSFYEEGNWCVECKKV